uniref:Aftiphilin clathrin-binding box domain-containing protein n=1 Tax=Suricata suricatta TaxID=37032 RepID=A0A673V1W6_SURSU
MECSDLQEPEELGVHTVCAQPCKALIQTQLPGTGGGRQGSRTAWSLFLKTPFHRSGQHLTIPRKRIFSPLNLKMTLFNSNVC